MRNAGSSEKAPVTEMRFATTSSEKNDGTGVQIGDVILRFTWFARSGVVRMGVTDQAAARIRTAPDRLWYPAEEKYRVQARWVPLDPTVKTSTADSTGDMRFDALLSKLAG